MKSENNNGAIGVVFLILIAIFYAEIIAVLTALFSVGVIGLIGYCIYRIIMYDRKTGNISNFFNGMFNFISQENTTVDLMENEEGVYDALPSPKEDEILEQVSKMNDRLTTLTNENLELKQGSEKKIEKALDEYSEQIERKIKNEFLTETFGDTKSKDYAKSDQHEKQQIAKKRADTEEELKNRTFRQDVKETVYNFGMEALADRFAIRSEMRDGFSYLEKQDGVIKQALVEKHCELDGKITTGIADLRTNFADLSKFVGKELYRVDSNMLKVMGKLQECSNSVERYSFEVKKTLIDSERQAIRGERMLSQAQSLYQRHKAEMLVLGKDVDVALKKVKLTDREFANKVYASKLHLERSSIQLNDSLKQISFEKMGTNLLRENHAKQTEIAEVKMNKLITEKRHIEDRMKTFASNDSHRRQLENQLFINKENLTYARNQNSIMQRETSLFKRLSK